MLYTQRFSPGENFRQFHHLLSLANFYHTNLLSCVNLYIEDMGTFTVLAKSYSLKYFKVAGLGECIIYKYSNCIL